MSSKPNSCERKIARSIDYMNDVLEIAETVIGYLLEGREDATFVASVIAREAFDFICAADGPKAARQELEGLMDDLDGLSSSTASSPDAMLLRAMVADPGGSQADWATATDVAKSTVYRRLKRLQEDGLVHGADGRWTVTRAGRRTI